MILGLVIAVAVVAGYAWQDGVHRCQDGDRYTSRQRQPTPFHRRFCSWPPRLLMIVTWTSFVAIAATLGGWRQALLFVMLPGVWFCSTHPTTVDGPAILLAWLSALAWHHDMHAVAIALSCVGAVVHERVPVFAALYGWQPWLLAGLLVVVVVSSRRPAVPNHRSPELADRLVGHGTLGAITAHRPYVDLLSDTGLVWSLRGLPLMMAHLGAGPAAWASVAVAFTSRLLGTDTSRFLLWAAPPICAGLGDAPLWMVALHVISFRRAMQ